MASRDVSSMPESFDNNSRRLRRFLITSWCAASGGGTEKFARTERHWNYRLSKSSTIQIQRRATFRTRISRNPTFERISRMHRAGDILHVGKNEAAGHFHSLWRWQTILRAASGSKPSGTFQ